MDTELESATDFLCIEGECIAENWGHINFKDIRVWEIQNRIFSNVTNKFCVESMLCKFWDQNKIHYAPVEIGIGPNKNKR